MAVNQGYGKIVTDGLVFAYDTNDYYNSFKGKPAANILTAMSYSYGEQNSALFKTRYGLEDVYIPAIGKTTAHFCEIYNDYSGGSGNCCPSPFSYGGDIRTGVVGGATYTYQIIYRTTTGYANGNYMYHYQYSDSAYITEYGLWNSSREEDLGDGWKHAWGTFTLNAATTRLYCYLFHYEYATFNKVQVAGVMLTQGDTIYRPHQFFPYGNSISNTGGLLNLAGSSTIDLSNVTFDTNGQMIFDGTNDAISVTTPSGFSGSGTWTLNTWFKINGAPSSTAYMNVILDMNPTGGSANMICVNWSDMRLQYRSRPVGGGYTDINGSILTQGVWYNATVVKNGTSDTKLYLNGVQDGGTYSGDLPAGNQSTFNIGRWTDGTVFANATIPVISIYNRALTAQEVTQNYNHYKSRFNI